MYVCVRDLGGGEMVGLTRWLIKITFFTDIQFSGIHKEINHVYVPWSFLVQYLFFWEMFFYAFHKNHTTFIAFSGAFSPYLYYTL